MNGFGNQVNFGFQSGGGYFVSQQKETPVSDNRGSYMFFHGDGRAVVQRYTAMDPEEVRHYQILQESGRLEAHLAFQRSRGMDVSDIEALFPSIYVKKSDNQVVWEKIQLVEAVSDFLEVVPIDTPAQILDDIQHEVWMEKVDGIPFHAPVGQFVEGPAYEDLRSTYDKMAEIIAESAKDKVDILYVPVWRDAMQGWYSGRETKVVSIPPNDGWLDIYFLSTFLPEDMFPQLVYDLKQGFTEGAEALTRSARQMLASVPQGVTPRGLRYVILYSNMPESDLQSFKLSCKCRWYDNNPVLVTYGVMPCVWEDGSSLVVVDLYNGTGLYFSPGYTEKYFKEDFKNRSGATNPSVANYYVTINQGSYRDELRMLSHYAYAHYCGYVYGGDVRTMMMRQLREHHRQSGGEILLNWFDLLWEGYGSDPYEKKIPNPEAGFKTICCWMGKIVSDEWFREHFCI